MTTKTMFLTALMGAILSCSITQGSVGEVGLPEGSAPAPIVAYYFPDRVHEFVWRNWNAVDTSKMAGILSATGVSRG